MTTKKRGLGRGLDVLIKSRVVEPGPDAEIVTIDITALTPNIHQPRHHFDPAALQELASSIKAQGLIQPVLVRPLETEGRFEIVAGERRWRACQMAGLTHIECIVRKMDEYESMAIALIENLQREDLNPMEEARALGQIKDHFEITQDELADKIGKSRPAVTNSLRLLKLPEKVQHMLEAGTLSAGHGRALLGVEDHKAIEFLADMVVAKGYNVRATEELIKKFKYKGPPAGMRKIPRKAVVENIANLIQHLSKEFSITHSGSTQKGKIVFAYASEQEREKITAFLERMTLEKTE